MSDRSNVMTRTAEAELERHFRGLRAFQNGRIEISGVGGGPVTFLRNGVPFEPEPEPEVKWSARDVRLFVGMFALLGSALAVGILIGRMF